MEFSFSLEEPIEILRDGLQMTAALKMRLRNCDTFLLEENLSR
jgi:hypothetical protein